MANRYRGEIDAVLDGRSYTLCLTLGALAELETAFAAESLPALLERFGSGHLSAADLVRIVGAGLRGAGADISDADVAAMRADGGAAGFATIAVALLQATFGDSTRNAREMEPEPASGGAGENPTPPQA